MGVIVDVFCNVLVYCNWDFVSLLYFLYEGMSDKSLNFLIYFCWFWVRYLIDKNNSVSIFVFLFFYFVLVSFNVLIYWRVFEYLLSVDVNFCGVDFRFLSLEEV